MTYTGYTMTNSPIATGTDTKANCTVSKGFCTPGTWYP